MTIHDCLRLNLEVFPILEGGNANPKVEATNIPGLTSRLD